MKFFSRSNYHTPTPEEDNIVSLVPDADTPLDRLKRGYIRTSSTLPDEEMKRVFFSETEDIDPESTDFDTLLTNHLTKREAEAECLLRRIEGKAEALRALCLSPDELTETNNTRARLRCVLDDIAAQRKILIQRRAKAEAQQRSIITTAKLEEEYATRHKAYAARRTDALRIARYEAALPVLSLWKEIALRQTELTEITDKEFTAEAEVADCRSRLEKAEHQFAQAQKELADAEEAQTASHEYIYIGQTLQTELEHLEKEYEKRTVLQEHAEAGILETEATLAKRRSALSETREHLQALCRHEDALNVHRLMFEKFDLVKDKLGSLRTESRLNEEYHEQFAELQKRLADLRQTASAAETEFSAQKSRLATLQNELSNHHQNLKGIDLNILDRRVTALAIRSATLRRAKSLWQNIATDYETKENLEAELQRRSMEANYRERNIERLENQAVSLREVWHRQNMTAALSMSHDVEQLRSELSEGRQCPVCGATHHPYHSDNIPHHTMLSTRLSDELSETHTRLQTLENEIIIQKEEQAAENARIDSIRDISAELRKRLDNNRTEWETLFNISENEHTSHGIDQQFSALRECSADVNRHMRHTMIDMLIESTDTLLEQARSELASSHLHQNKINSLNEQIDLLSAKTAEEHARLNELQTETRITASTLELLQNRLDTNDRTVSGLYTDLDEMITLSGWFVMWKNNPDALRVYLTSLFTDWQKTQNDISATRHTLDSQEKELKNDEQILTERRTRIENIAAQLLSLKESANARREEYMRLFAEDKSPEALATRQHEAVDNAHKALEIKRHELFQANTAVAELRNLLTALTERRKKTAARIAELTTRLELKLQAAPAEAAPQPAELEHIFTEDCDWNALRSELEKLRTSLEIARQTLDKARTDQHRLHAEKPEDLEAITRYENTLNEHYMQTIDQFEEITGRLTAHHESIRRLKILEPELKAARNAYMQQEKIRKAWEAGK